MLTVFFLWGVIGSNYSPTASAADEYDGLRTKWKEMLAGDSAYNPSDPDIAPRIQEITNTANERWNTMDTSSSRTFLWSDLASTTNSAHVSDNFGRLKAMAVAYATRGSSLYNNSALGDDIVNGLDWIYANRYNENKSAYGNWWDWEIGAPQYLTDILILMYDDMAPSQLAQQIKALDKFNPDPTVGSTLGVKGVAMTGANRSDKAQVVALRGIIGKSSAKIAQARDALTQIFGYVTSGDGFYADGSFVQHTDIAYTGSYGNVLLGGVSKLLYLLGGSTWAVTNPNVANVYRWVKDAYEPLVYNATMMDMVYGRAISRAQTGPFRPPLASIALLAQSASPADSQHFMSMIKYWVESDPSWNELDGLSIRVIGMTKSIMNDSTVPSRGPLAMNRMFASMARAVHNRPDFGFGISMFSNRISAFEYGNGENSKGWWTGVGMTYLYNADVNQYADNYWATIDMKRLPGTTTDGSGSGTPGNWGSYRNPRNWVGGSSVDGALGSAGMDFSMAQNTGTSLQGKKSWFMFDDEIVALGSGIASSDNRKAETIIDNRKLNESGTNALQVNGSSMPTNIGWSQSINGVDWIQLAGNVPGAGMGYYFPDSTSVAGLRETRTGSWHDVNSGESSTSYSRNYLSLAINHGNNPSGASYAYVTLPNRDASAVSAYASQPDIQILENSASAHAVKEKTLNAVGVNFWNDGTKTVSVDGQNFITSNKKASMTTIETPSDISIGVSDPTQSNTGTIEVEINRQASQPLMLDPGITVNQLSPTIKLTINVNGAQGKTFAAKFALSGTTGNQQTLNPEADASVRDGIYAAVNYGSSAVLDVKTETTDYTRYAYLKFNLSSLSGAVSSAMLRLVPVSAGSSGLVNQLESVATNSWIESGLTWNNKPAVGSMINSWSVPATSTPVLIDITAEVNAAISGNKILSLRISSPSNQGSLGWVQYGSREHGTAAYQPGILISQNQSSQ
ncbi:DNRLRE domain-containing protein [Paenibacillus sp. HJL G12]|uniref:DNRLRE domain-containing protein n=2 Tax=Paenibacillus dendrobii TaxID=2691084 RepID=A0A7X3IIF3_9BACL|nr:DNRLRE domain-containing protein [Paenibacillus dendrobii]